MKEERGLTFRRFEPGNRIIIVNPIPIILTEDPSVTGEIRPAKFLIGTVAKKENVPHVDDYYIVDLDAPVFYISERDQRRTVKRLEAVRESWGNMELFYDRPSLSEVK